MSKRCFDIFFSSIALILLTPILLIIAAFIKLIEGSPILYKQERIGRDFRPFVLYKFRTMLEDSGKVDELITVDGDERITKTGRILRKYKLDEIPQLINVLKGDMSIVGPRPEVSKYVEIFREDYKTILKIKPGLTDLATLEFRDEERILSNYDDPEWAYINVILPRKLELSKEYVEKSNLLLDIIIIARTIKSIVRF